jgi:hypothetical protein
VLLPVGERNLPAVLVTNSSDQPHSFTIAASWKQGDSTVAISQGAVFCLEPREVRAINLASDTPIPTGATPGDAHVDRVLPVDQHQLQVSDKIKFGTASVQKGALSSVDVPVTNTDNAPHNLSLGAALLSKGQLIGTASGSLPNIGPRITLPANLTIAGDDSGYDSILTYVTAVNS